MSIRVLCLGNEPVGPAVARALRELTTAGVQVVEGGTAATQLLDCERLVVVDRMTTGLAEAGAVIALRENEVACIPGASPDYVGLFETMEAARRTGALVPEAITILAVEGEDETKAAAAVPEVVARVLALTDQAQLEGRNRAVCKTDACSCCIGKSACNEPAKA